MDAGRTQFSPSQIWYHSLPWLQILVCHFQVAQPWPNYLTLPNPKYHSFQMQVMITIPQDVGKDSMRQCGQSVQRSEQHVVGAQIMEVPFPLILSSPFLYLQTGVLPELSRRGVSVHCHNDDDSWHSTLLVANEGRAPSASWGFWSRACGGSEESRYTLLWQETCVCIWGPKRKYKRYFNVLLQNA